MSLTTWRLTQPEYAATAMSGEGSTRYPGRWNPRGVRVAYTSESLSLAALEILAHAFVTGHAMAVDGGYVAQ